MKVEAVNTREKATIKLYDRRGRTNKVAVRRLYRVMRCHQTKTQRRIHWRLVSALYRISRQFKGKTIQIYSGYRSRKVASLDSSYHIKGMAADISIPGVTKQTLRDYLRRTFKHSGVGYYPNTPFVHFDVRKKAAFWVDLSGKGQNARYAPNAYTFLKDEKTKKSPKTPEPSRIPAAATAGQATAAGGGDPPPATAEVDAKARPASGAAAAAVSASKPAGPADPGAAEGARPGELPAGPPSRGKPSVVQGPPPLGPAPDDAAAKKQTDAPARARPAPVAEVSKGAPATNGGSRTEQKLVKQPPAAPGRSVDDQVVPEEEAKVRRGGVSKIRSAP